MSNKSLTKTICQLEEQNTYIGTAIALLDINVENGDYLLPRGCIDVTAQTPKTSYVAQRDFALNAWQYLAGYHGQTVYSTQDSSTLTLNEIGDLPESYTFVQPPSSNHTWNGKTWVITAETRAPLKTAAQ